MDAEGKAEVYMRERKKERKKKNGHSVKSHRREKAN